VRLGEGKPSDPSASPRSAELDLEQLIPLWPAVVELIRGRNMMLAALLAEARPVGLHGSELTVGLPANAAFSKRKAETEEHRRAAADAVRNVTGVSLSLRYELIEEQGQELAAPEGAVPLSDEDIVRRFVEEFDAQEIDQES
jgi:hypothetical protein